MEAFTPNRREARVQEQAFVEIFVIRSCRLVDEAQESRHKMLLQIVVDSGVHLRGEVGQQKRVVAQLELVVVREQWLKFGDVERIELRLHGLVLRLPTTIISLAHGLQAVEDEFLIELRQCIAPCVFCQAEETNELVCLYDDCIAAQHERLDLWDDSFVPHNGL